MDNNAENVSIGYWQDAWRRLKLNKMAMAGLAVIIVIIFFAVFGPLFCKMTYFDQDMNNVNKGPCLEFWFGTDNLGRDMLVRTMYGARISLAIGFVASIINLCIGVVYGGVSGFVGGKVDRLMMNLVDVIYSVPSMLYVILLMVILKPGLMNIFVAMGIAFWIGMARMVRGQILALKEQEFVLAAKTIGASNTRILFRHLLPNSVGTIVVMLSLAIPSAIFTEAFLSFIGLGVSAPMASWGVMASEGVSAMRAYPYQLFFPAMGITITLLAFNFFSEGLRDVLDPRMRR